MDALKLLATIELPHAGDCALLGVDHEGCVYVEELYGEDDWLAQHIVSLSAGVLESADEQCGTVPPPAPLPALRASPSKMKVFDHLNFSGARWRGRMADERVEDMLRHLSIAEKIALVDYLDWEIDPLRLLGIAESIVLSCCPYSDGEYLVCRRIRVAYRLPAAQSDDHGLDRDYDYDSVEVHLLHRLPADTLELPDLSECLTEFDLCRPLDCMRLDGKFYLADGGEGAIKSALHVFEIATSGDEAQHEIATAKALDSD
ncbi:MAG: hypothetical protein OXG39_04880 [Chloroflexi bacterium]|nr:hypothetical protein [Chloroflexota bacterium]